MKNIGRFFALIPAGGKSTRMGRQKLSLPLGDRTVVEHAVGAFAKAGVDSVLVVAAPHNAELAPLARAAGAEVLLLDEETTDMRTTIEKGLNWIEANASPDISDAWFLSPADHPTLRPDVIAKLQAVWREIDHAGVIIPVHEQKRGHPALISWQHVAGIRALPAHVGLNAYFRKPEVNATELSGFSAEVLMDLDTPEDYEKLKQYWQNSFQ